MRRMKSANVPCALRTAYRSSGVNGRWSSTRVTLTSTAEDSWLKGSFATVCCSCCRMPQRTQSCLARSMLVARTTSSSMLMSASRARCRARERASLSRSVSASLPAPGPSPPLPWAPPEGAGEAPVPAAASASLPCCCCWAGRRCCGLEGSARRGVTSHRLNMRSTWMAAAAGTDSCQRSRGPGYWGQSLAQLCTCTAAARAVLHC
jgi:hypothetical protein